MKNFLLIFLLASSCSFVFAAKTFNLKLFFEMDEIPLKSSNLIEGLEDYEYTKFIEWLSKFPLEAIENINKSELFPKRINEMNFYARCSLLKRLLKLSNEEFQRVAKAVGMFSIDKEGHNYQDFLKAFVLLNDEQLKAIKESSFANNSSKNIYSETFKACKKLPIQQITWIFNSEILFKFKGQSKQIVKILKDLSLEQISSLGESKLFSANRRYSDLEILEILTTLSSKQIEAFNEGKTWLKEISVKDFSELVYSLKDEDPEKIAAICKSPFAQKNTYRQENLKFVEALKILNNEQIIAINQMSFLHEIWNMDDIIARINILAFLNGKQIDAIKEADMMKKGMYNKENLQLIKDFSSYSPERIKAFATRAEFFTQGMRVHFHPEIFKTLLPLGDEQIEAIKNTGFIEGMSLNERLDFINCLSKFSADKIENFIKETKFFIKNETGSRLVAIVKTLLSLTDQQINAIKMNFSLEGVEIISLLRAFLSIEPDIIAAIGKGSFVNEFKEAKDFDILKALCSLTVDQLDALNENNFLQNINSLAHEQIIKALAALKPEQISALKPTLFTSKMCGYSSGIIIEKLANFEKNTISALGEVFPFMLDSDHYYHLHIISILVKFTPEKIVLFSKIIRKLPEIFPLGSKGGKAYERISKAFSQIAAIDEAGLFRTGMSDEDYYTIVRALAGFSAKEKADFGRAICSTNLLPMGMHESVCTSIIVQLVPWNYHNILALGSLGIFTRLMNQESCVGIIHALSAFSSEQITAFGKSIQANNRALSKEHMSDDDFAKIIIACSYFPIQHINAVAHAHLFLESMDADARVKIIKACAHLEPAKIGSLSNSNLFLESMDADARIKIINACAQLDVAKIAALSNSHLFMKSMDADARIKIINACAQLDVAKIEALSNSHFFLANMGADARIKIINACVPISFGKIVALDKANLFLDSMDENIRVNIINSCAELGAEQITIMGINNFLMKNLLETRMPFYMQQWPIINPRDVMASCNSARAIAQCASLNPDQIIALGKTNFFTLDMNDEERTKIIVACSSLSPEQIIAVGSANLFKSLILLDRQKAHHNEA